MDEGLRGRGIFRCSAAAKTSLNRIVQIIESDTRQAVRGRGLGRIGGIPLARGQLPFQIGDLFFGIASR